MPRSGHGRQRGRGELRGDDVVAQHIAEVGGGAVDSYPRIPDREVRHRILFHHGESDARSNELAVIQASRSEGMCVRTY